MLFASLLLSALPLFAQDHDVQASPFDGLRWSADAPEVLIDGVWYRPVAIDDIEVEAVLALCQRRWPGRVQKRFGEDLVEALALLEWRGDLEVDLDLVRLDDGAEVRLEGVEMTRARRNAIRDSAGSSTPVPTRSTVSADRARADVAAFGSGLRERFAYAAWRGIDLDAELARIEAELGDPVSTAELGRSLHRLLMRFGDGHADVSSPASGPAPGDGKLPFLLVESSAGVVAIEPDRSGLVDPKRPVVQALDGRPLSEWLAAASPDVAAGSPQLVRRRSLRALRELDALRRELGEPTGGPVRVTFADAKGRRTTERELELTSRRPTYGTWPRAETGMLPGKLGYLRLPRMDDSVGALRRAMDELKDTRGLVVDVRGNGGGSRHLLLALAGYLIGPDEPAVVANVARYRLHPEFGDRHLDARFMYRADRSGWSEGARAAIEACAASFEPEWDHPEGFSEWHYLVLERTGESGEYFYEQPVVVLSDAGCFSATDIFLGGMTLLPRVTLLGTASSGGSARSQTFRLPGTGMRVKCASMASFRPDGRLYDGRGIEVDEEVLPEPEDFLLGDSDAQLEAAIKLLKRRSR
ncbi:MAG: S41 family peptidase [Planctomycetota bacterium]